MSGASISKKLRLYAMMNMSMAMRPADLSIIADSLDVRDKLIESQQKMISDLFEKIKFDSEKQRQSLADLAIARSNNERAEKLTALALFLLMATAIVVYFGIL